DRLVFVDGFFAPALSTSLPGGARVASLAQALRENPETIQHHLCKYAKTDERPFCALNTAFVAEGAFVHVPAKLRVAEPIQLLFLTTTERQVVVHPRNLVVVEREARASIVETYAALAENVYWTNAVTEIVVGDGARVDYHRVQRESNRAFHVAATQSHQGQGSTLTRHFVTVGPLDPRALFYLRSRGVGEDEARRLLTYGFAAEILGRVEVAPLRVQLDRIVRDRVAQP